MTTPDKEPIAAAIRLLQAQAAEEERRIPEYRSVASALQALAEQNNNPHQKDKS